MLKFFERRFSRAIIPFIEIATRVAEKPRLQSGYDPSARLDTRKLLQVTGRRGT